ncbi:NAD(P)-dependent oxidoreductase [Chitinophaga vietnamensis]|uniref:NAD(P)-dependent oxidoreductase n=1 Tax=Chitinophaga vietnamensis TaxID=2593957 RepID=UPI001178A5F0|nr:NAD(P)-dependent oxidoreductase [Chitinophaga vietnamensis]
MKTGFIGLGNLGIAIAENLLARQQPLYVYNRTASKAQLLIEKGAIVCSSVQELAAQCDVVFTIVSDDAALNHITMGAEGIASHLRKGGIHISLSTILPATATALHQLHSQHGSEYIACPVMGRPDVARARKINFLVSGHHESIQQIKPLLEQAGAVNVWEFGDAPGAANVAKLCSNYLVITAMEAIAESVNLAKRSNIDTALWMQMLTQTYFNAPVYINYSALIMKEAFLPAGFSLQLGLKDMNLILQQAGTVNARMPVGHQVQSLLQQSLAAGLGDHDITAVAKTIGESSKA